MHALPLPSVVRASDQPYGAPRRGPGATATERLGRVRVLAGTCCVASRPARSVSHRTSPGGSRGRGPIMNSASALMATASRRSGSLGWDDCAPGAGQQGRERHAANASGTSDEPVADACLQAYRRDAAGRLALAALGQHHGPLA